MRFLRAFFFLFIAFLLVSATETPAQGTKSNNPYLLVLNKAEASLTIVDPLTMTVVGKVPVGDSPHEVVATGDGKLAIVANYGAQKAGNSLSVIDLATKKELRRVDLSPLWRPHGLQEINGKIYFTAETNRVIARYDPAANKVDWMMGTGQSGSHMIVGTADEKRFYTANIGSDSVTAFELVNAQNGIWRVTHIAVGKQPEAIDISPDGKEIWAGLNAEGAIDIVDTATNKFKEKVNLGGRPYRVKFTPDGKSVFNTMFATKEILVIDAATRKETKRIKLESAPLGITFSKDGKFAFVTVVESDFVLKIDLEKFETVGKVETGKAPDGVALSGM